MTKPKSKTPKPTKGWAVQHAGEIDLNSISYQMTYAKSTLEDIYNDDKTARVIPVLITPIVPTRRKAK